METLLQIVENTENDRKAKKSEDHGIYKFNIDKEAGFARNGMPFFEPDAMHEYLLTRKENLAFPPFEDLPRNGHVSFDVFYYVSAHSNVVHRITITRAHDHEPTFIKACFVDGDLIYMSGGGIGKLKVYLFNSQEKGSGAIQGNNPRFWFLLENQRIDVIADAYCTFEKKVWRPIATKSPCHYGIFVNDQSTITRNSTLIQYQLQYKHYWVTVLSILFFFPCLATMDVF